MTDTETAREDTDETVIGYRGVGNVGAIPQFCTDCGEEVAREVEELTESDVEHAEKLSCTLCGTTFYDDGEPRPIVETSITASATAHNFSDRETTLRKGDVKFETEVIIECTCERHVTITNGDPETCECGREWDGQHGTPESPTFR